MKKGDIIVNPWVAKYYDGKLNPMYATIYLGDNHSLDYNGEKRRWTSKVYQHDEKNKTPWRVVVHVDLTDMLLDVIEEAIMKGGELE